MGAVAGVGGAGQLSTMPASVLEKQDELIRAMSAEEKVRASQALRAAAWDLKAAWIRSRHPDLAEVEVQAAVRQWFRDAGA